MSVRPRRAIPSKPTTIQRPNPKSVIIEKRKKTTETKVSLATRKSPRRPAPGCDSKVKTRVKTEAAPKAKADAKTITFTNRPTKEDSPLYKDDVRRRSQQLTQTMLDRLESQYQKQVKARVPESCMVFMCYNSEDVLELACTEEDDDVSVGGAWYESREAVVRHLQSFDDQYARFYGDGERPLDIWVRDCRTSKLLRRLIAAGPTPAEDREYLDQKVARLPRVSAPSSV